MTEDFFENYEPPSDEVVEERRKELMRREMEGEPLFQLSDEQIKSLKDAIDIDEIVSVLGGEIDG